jgi:hypothetical protein
VEKVKHHERFFRKKFSAAQNTSATSRTIARTNLRQAHRQAATGEGIGELRAQPIAVAAHERVGEFFGKFADRFTQH